MRYGSVCSGIEAATVALAPLGWTPGFFSEIEPFCCALLQHHYPTVPNLRDLTTIHKEDFRGSVDLLIGGTPCQSFSVAGRRGGLADPRGNLTLEYFALIDRLRPRWVVWENVPGLLSDDDGRTFGTCLGLLGDCGYGFAYRVLNAEHFGVPQRRYRVFTVGYLGDWRPPAAVLTERHSLSGHPAPGREAWEDVAACLTQGVDSQGKGEYAGRRREDDVNLVAYAFGGYASAAEGIVTNQSQASGGPSGLGISEETAYGLRSGRTQSIACTPFDTTQITSKTNRSQPKEGDPCHPLTGTGHAPTITAYVGAARLDFESETFAVRTGHTAANGHHVSHETAYACDPTQRQAIAFTERTRTDGRNLETLTDTSYALCNPGNGGRAQSYQVLAPCLTQNYGKQPDNSDTGEGPMLVHEGMMVRRLTPLECERLQGLPDNYTLVPYRGKLAKDAPRYRAIGNSFAVPVIRWIGQRIQRVEELLR